MRQLRVIQHKQAISAAEITQEQYIYCGSSVGMFLLSLCLSLMTSVKSHGSLRDSELAYLNNICK